MTKTTYIFFDPDLDGYCAAHIVATALAEKNPDINLFLTSIPQAIQISGVDENALTLHIEEGADAPMVKENADHIYFVDLHPTEGLSKALADLQIDFTVIDHHVSPNSGKVEIKADSDGMQSSCTLAWNKFYNGQVTPMAVDLIRKWDCWLEGAEDWLDQVVPFRYGMKQFNLGERALWGALLFTKDTVEKATNVQNIINMGNPLAQYWINEMNVLLGEGMYVKEIDGLKFLVVNGPIDSSYDMHHGFNQEHLDAMMAFQYMPDGRWLCKFKSSKQDVDLTSIMTKYNGVGSKWSVKCYMNNEQIKEWLNA